MSLVKYMPDIADLIKADHKTRPNMTASPTVYPVAESRRGNLYDRDLNDLVRL